MNSPTAPTIEDPIATLLAPWSGPYGGVPPFGRVQVPAFRAALEVAMAGQLAEINAIADQSAPANFDNTIAPFEASGRALQRVLAVYHVYSSTLNDDAMQAVEREMEPQLAAFHDAITQNSKLFARIAAVYEQRERYSPEQQRVCWLHYNDFKRTGAALNDADKQQLSAINQQLASLFTDFSQRVLKDEEEIQLVITQPTDLDGLPAAETAAAAAEAEERGLKGKWVIANTRSSVEPFLTYAKRRDLRERVWRNFVMRGDTDGRNDTKQLIKEILKLRAARARLLGHATHAHWTLDDAMAKTPERAMQLLRDMWAPAVGRVKEEVADMQRLADADGIHIEPWDYRYYAEQVRKARYDLDANELKPYLQLEKLREGMFMVAATLFSLRFVPVSDVPVYHPDVRVWEVQNEYGMHVGLWYFDPYARRGKQSGAWMSEYRGQQNFAGVVTPIVSNNANFLKGQPGEPVLLNWDDAVTLFHEFGHALHGLLSAVRYPSLAGTSVARDFVEFPSQLLEHWLLTPALLNRYALHYQTNEPIPAELLDKITRARNFNQGFATLEYLASALIDMELHLTSEQPIDVTHFERETLTALGMPAEVVMRHRTPQFSHVFSGDGYAAGYYSYLWADTLVADAWEAFTESGDHFNPDLAARLHEHVFSAGNRVDPAEAYRDFRGRDPDVQALMRKRGFAAG